uniref:Sushi domain-containing protein n=1 Tax=Mola mola TaxID=94237 RepID=A0A3Q3X0D1_MOLML
MCGRHLGFVLLVLFPGLLHAQDEVQICQAPRLLDGYLVPEQERYYHDTQVSYGCDKGRKPLMDGWWATITCHNGTWSAVPQCIDENACSPLTIPNGKSTVNKNGWYKEEDTTRVTCDKGFEHRNRDATAKCINGKWTSVPVCERSNHTCNAPPQISHAVVVNQQYKELFAVDSEVEYQCEDEYTINGADNKKTIYCIAGYWTEGPVCSKWTVCLDFSSSNSGSSDNDTERQKTEVRNCGPIPVVPNSVYDINRMYLRYQCGSYYKRVGPERVECYDNGLWSELPYCQDAFCAVDTHSIPELKPVGVKYFRHGETFRFECVREAEWWYNNYSQFRCTERGPTFTRCKYHFNIMTYCSHVRFHLNIVSRDTVCELAAGELC